MRGPISKNSNSRADGLSFWRIKGKSAKTDTSKVKPAQKCYVTIWIQSTNLAGHTTTNGGTLRCQEEKEA
jgi:hypothetical protein